MSEVATVSGQATVKPGTGGAKAAGAGATAASVLDGAFAALLGKAGDGTPGSYAALLTAGGNGAGTAQGEADLTQTGDTDEAVGTCVVEFDGFLPLGEAQARSPRAKLRGAADEASPIAIAANLPAAVIPPATGDAPAVKAGASEGEAGIDAVDALKTGKQPAAADAAAKVEAEISVKRAAAAPVQAQPQGAQTQNTQSPSQTALAASAGQSADGSTQNGAQNGEAQSEGGQGRSPASNAQIASAASQGEDSSPPAIDSSLRSIMQALPPVLQSQLSVAAAGGSTPAVASTGELLGNQVIDMSVSGQWIDRMAREIASLAEGTGHSRFQLSPPNLGKIQVDLWRNEDSMNLRLITETDEAARRLNEGKSALEAHARVASLSLGQVSVEKASSSESARDQGQNQQQQRQGAESSGGQGQQQANAQAQGQSAQGRGQGNANRDGVSAVIGQDQAGATSEAARSARANDPHVRFA